MNDLADGIYTDVTIDQYLRQNGLRSGDISLAADVLARYWHRKQIEDVEKPWAPFGVALHYRILEPAKFDFMVAIAPPVDRRTKAGKEAWDAFIEANPGKVVIKQDEFQEIESMWHSVQDSDTAKKILEGIQTEVTVVWHDQATGAKCQARLDGWNEEKGIIVELKVVRSAKLHQFASQICECGWHRQAAHQAAGMKANGKKVKHHVFLAIEKDAPHLLSVVELDPVHVELAERSNSAVIKKIHTATQLNHFPGYDDFIQVLNLPEWGVKQLENTL